MNEIILEEVFFGDFIKNLAPLWRGPYRAAVTAQKKNGGRASMGLWVVV